MAMLDPICFSSHQPEKISALMKNLYPALTPKEGLCLFWACLDLTKMEIAQRLSVSENTVKTHIKSGLKKQKITSLREIKTSFLANIIIFFLFN